MPSRRIMSVEHGSTDSDRKVADGIMQVSSFLHVHQHLVGLLPH